MVEIEIFYKLNFTIETCYWKCKKKKEKNAMED